VLVSVQFIVKLRKLNLKIKNPNSIFKIIWINIKMDSAFLFLGTHQMKTKLILLTSLSLLTVACSRQEPPAVQPQPQVVYQQAPT